MRLVTPTAASAVVIASVVYAARSRPRPSRCRRDHAQNRLATKLTTTPAANAAMLATAGPVCSPRYARAKVTALTSVARADPTE